MITDLGLLLTVTIISIIVWLVISFYFFRWTFSVKRQLWNQRQMIYILIKMAEKLGAGGDDLDTIRRKLDVSDEYLNR